MSVSVWLHCYKKSLFTLLGAKTDTDATQFLDSIKKIFNENKKIIKCFGKLINTKILKDNGEKYTVNANEVEFTNGTYIKTCLLYTSVELDRQVTELKSNVEKKILSNINPMMDKLIKIALKSSSDKTSLDAIIYALNRVLGTPTNKTQEVNDGNNKNSAPVNIEEMLCQINVDNVLDSKGNDPI